MNDIKDFHILAANGIILARTLLTYDEAKKRNISLVARHRPFRWLLQVPAPKPSATFAEVA